MNRIYRVIWNASKGAWQAVAEIGRSRGKTGASRMARRAVQSRFILRRGLSGAAGVLLATGIVSAQAADLPQGGSIAAGSGVIAQDGAVMTVTQTSERMVADWQSFGIGQGHTVNFVQPSSQAAALNRVLGADVSVIQGALNANGQVFLVNPNGVLFTPTAQVNVGGLVASTLNLSKDDFLAGNYRFEGQSTQAVVNQGRITAYGEGAGGGTVALIAAKVTNSGELTAHAGNVLLGAGSRVTLDMGGPVKLQVEQGALDALIAQGGAIRADGGLVYLTAKAAGDLASTVINHTGVTQAQTLATGESGQIFLLGGMQADTISVGGTLDASAPVVGDGGFIETSASKVAFQADVAVSTLASQGKTGKLLIDPNDYVISSAAGADISGAQLSSLLSGSDIWIRSVEGSNQGNGDIIVNDEVTWHGPATLLLEAERNIEIRRDITASNGGKLALYYGQSAPSVGNTASYTLLDGARINLQAGENFMTVRGMDDPGTIWTVITSLGSSALNGANLQGMAGNLAGNYVLGTDIDASATASWNDGKGFTPIGNTSTAFTGQFDGLGHTIRNVTIDRAATDNVGLFGMVNHTNASIRNVTLENATVIGQSKVGALIGGLSNGVVYDAHASGSVSGTYNVGGLVGQAGTEYGTPTGGLRHVSAGVAVSGTGGLGGLVGQIYLPIQYAYATGAVTGTDSLVGGLVGRASSSVSDAYAIGSATGADSVGGLIGLLYSSGSVARAYATGAVQGQTNAGGLVGRVSGSASVSSSVWNMQTTGQLSSAGGVGKTTAEMMSSSTYTGWSLSNVGGDGTIWRLYEGNGTPLLRHFLKTVTLNILPTVPLVGKAYDGTTNIDSGMPINMLWYRHGVAFVLDYSMLTGAALRYASADVGVAALVKGYGSKGNGYDIVDVPLPGPIMGAITPKTLTISGTTVADKVYDGNTVASVTAGNLSGLVSGETLGLSVSAYFDAKDAGSRTATAIYTLMDGVGGKASNYTLLNTSGHAAAITPKTLTINGTTASDKIYDGNTVATMTAGTLSGMVLGETLSVSASGYFDDKDAGSRSATAVYTLADGAGVNGGKASNYALLSTSGHSATITPKTLTISGTTASDKVYDGNMVATLTAGTLSGLVSGETLGVSASGYFDDKDAGSRSATAAYTLADGAGVNGGKASNYTLLNTSGHAASITPKTLTISGTTASDKVYDGNTVATLTAGTLSGLVSGETLGVSASGYFDDRNAGSRSATAAYTLADGAGVNGGKASNYALLNTSGHAATITPKTLTINGTTASDKVYDGNTVATLTAGTLSGLVSGETLGVSASGYFDDKDAGSRSATAAYTLADGAGVNGGKASNYALLSTSGHVASITPKTLTISGTTASDKVYDGNTVATLTAGALSGLVSGETLGVSASGYFDDKDAGSRSTTAAYTLADGAGINGGKASNYALLNTSGHAATITPKTLTISGTTASDKVYDGNTVATLTAGALSGLVSGETLGVSASGYFDDRDAGGRIATATYALADGAGINGGKASNYLLSGTSGHAATITPKTLTISGTTASDKVYDGSTVATLTAGALSGLVSDETLGVSASGYFDGKDAGSRSATAAYTLADGAGVNGGKARNYVLLNTSGHAASITPKTLTISGTTASDKVYDGNAVATLTAGSLSGLVSGETLGVSASGHFDDKDAGGRIATATYALADGAGINGGKASNYTLLSTSGHAATITPKTLTISGTTASDKVYDGNTVATLTAGTLSGLLSGESLGVSASGYFDDKDAGGRIATATYALADGAGINGGKASNYTLLSTSGHAATITPKTLTISGTTASDKVYDGNTVAALTAGTLSGLVSGETLGVSASGYFDDKDAGSRSATATYTLADGAGVNGGKASNYALLSTSGHAATITPKTLTISGTTASDKVYDGNMVATMTAGALSGLVSGETLGVSASGYFDDRDAGGRIATATYALADGAGINGGKASNYLLSGTSGHAATITPKTLTISGTTASDKVYDGSTVATLTAGALSGLVSDETLGVSASGYFDGKDAGSRSATAAYTLADGAGVNGGKASNYTLLSTSGHAATITPKTLTISGTTASDKVYDGNTVAALTAGTLSGLVLGETLGVSASGYFDDRDAGNRTATAAYTLADGAGVNGGKASNYALLSTSGHAATITPKTLMISGTTASDKVYDGNTVATLTAGALSGLVSGETLGVSASGYFDDKDAGSRSATAAYTLADGAGVNGGKASNYVLLSTSGHAATITPKMLTISGTTASDKAYDGNAVATLTAGALSGLVSGETLGVSASGYFDDKDAGSRSATAAYTLADGAGVNGGKASNYTLLSTSGHAASITPKTLTISGTTASDKVYDGNTVATLTAGALSGLVSGETLGVSASGYFDDKDAGSRSATAAYTLADGAGINGGKASNYALLSTSGHSATITPKTLTIHGIAASDKVYDGSTTAELDMAGVVYGGLLAGDDVVLSAAGSFLDGNAGNDKRVILSSAYTGGDLGNYQVVDQTSATASIHKRNISVAAVDQAKFYGDTDPVLNWRLDEGEIVSGDRIQGQLYRDAGENEGVYAIHADALANENYQITKKEGSLTIMASAQQLQSAALVVQETGMGNAVQPAVAKQPAFVAHSASPLSTSISAPGQTGLILVPANAEGNAVAQPGGDASKGSQPQPAIQAGRDETGFMRVLVLSGGINLPEQAAASWQAR